MWSASYELGWIWTISSRIHTPSKRRYKFATSTWITAPFLPPPNKSKHLLIQHLKHHPYFTSKLPFTIHLLSSFIHKSQCTKITQRSIPFILSRFPSYHSSSSPISPLSTHNHCQSVLQKISIPVLLLCKRLLERNVQSTLIISVYVRSGRTLLGK